MSEPMTDDAIREALGPDSAWRVEDDRLTRELRFGGFGEALAFLVRLGIEVEKRDHHPDLTLVYDRVTVAWTSHDAGGVTDRDLDGAALVDRLLGD